MARIPRIQEPVVPGKSRWRAITQRDAPTTNATSPLRELQLAVMTFYTVVVLPKVLSEIREKRS